MSAILAQQLSAMSQPAAIASPPAAGAALSSAVRCAPDSAVAGSIGLTGASAAGALLGGIIGDRIGRNRIIWFSILGALPFSLALQRTGGVELAADAVTALAGEAAPHVILGLLFVITAMLGLFISNTATAVLMAPVALAMERELLACLSVEERTQLSGLLARLRDAADQSI